MKKLLTLIILAALGGGGWYAYQHKAFGLNQSAKEGAGGPGGAAGPGGPVQTAVAEVRDIQFSIQISGDVQPNNSLDVKAEVGGRVKKLHVIAGDTVKAGDILLEIDDRDILTELESAKTEIDGANLTVDKMTKNFERAKELHQQKLISQEAYDNLDSEMAIAKNSLSRAERKKQLVEDKLSKTTIAAPGDGTILTMPLVEGQVVIPAASVNSGTALMTIANLSKLIVETHVNQVDVSKLSPKQNVKLTSESIRDEEFSATIFFIAPVATVKNSVKGFTVQALIEKPSPRLRPGMTVQMTVPIANAQDVVAVPVNAVFRGEGNSRVVYVRDGDKTVRRKVQVGVTNTEFAQIVDGVTEGELILLAEPERGPRTRQARPGGGGGGPGGPGGGGSGRRRESGV